MTNSEKSPKEVSLFTAIASVLISVSLVILVGYIVGEKFFWKPAVPVDPYAFEIAQAEQKVQLDPKNVKKQMILSYAYLRKGDGQSALKTLKIAEKLEPKNKQIAYNLGLAYNQLKNYQQAIKYLEPQLTGGIIDFNLNYQLGDAYMGTKQYAKAVERYKSCVLINPGAADAYLMLARAYQGNGNNEMAENAVNKALRLVPDYAEAKQLLSQINGGK